MACHEVYRTTGAVRPRRGDPVSGTLEGVSTPNHPSPTGRLAASHAQTAKRAVLLLFGLCLVTGCANKDGRIRIVNEETGHWVEIRQNAPEFDAEKRRELLIRFRENPKSLANMSPDERFELQRMRAAALLKDK